ncbi:hypothetical protein ACQP08_23525 [Micromonospora zamorensis]|uniref:hypothetical protein n=1 Tax=Micromonospora zamorensis TaxID=709883 RepID=UPI003D90EDF5
MITGTVDDLRTAWLATTSAADRAGAHLHGAGPPGRRLPWQDAVTECWRALSLVYAGLAADRNPPTTAALRGLLAGRLRGHEWRLRRFAEPDWRRYADLLAGARPGPVKVG